MVKKKESTEPQEGEIVGAIEAPVKPKRKPSSAVTIKQPEISVVAGLALTTDQLKAALETQTDQRKLIAEFIKKHLIKGTDYIRIHVVSNCAAEDKQRGSCRNKYHFSKDILAKPGQEKIFSLFQLTSKLEKDVETLEMLGIKGLVAYKCLAIRDGVVIAEGRGAAVVGDKRRDANATIKIAEKRARMDACLALGFSEFFAQDLDDPDYKMQKDAAEEQAAGRGETPPEDDGTGLPVRDKAELIDDVERQMLAKYMLKLGFGKKEEQLQLLQVNGIDIKNFTSGQARELIVKMKNNAFANPTTNTILDDLDPNDPDAVDAAFAKMKDDKKIADLKQEPELVVDDDFKLEVERLASEIELNARGTIWLMRQVSGKPFAKWETLKDEEWRRAYDFVNGILESKIEVDPGHIKDGFTPAEEAA